METVWSPGLHIRLITRAVMNVSHLDSSPSGTQGHYVKAIRAEHPSDVRRSGMSRYSSAGTKSVIT